MCSVCNRRHKESLLAPLLLIMVAIDRRTSRSNDRRSKSSYRTRVFLWTSLLFGAVGVVQFWNRDGDGTGSFWETTNVAATATSSSSSFTAQKTSLRSTLVDSLECRYYLAESAIPMGGLGLYTAVDIMAGQQAQSLLDICIYVADTPDHTDFETHSWARDVFFGQFEGANPRGACEGFATLFNSMPDGVKTSELRSPRMQTNAGLDRKQHPGAGAISHHYGVTSTAVRDVRAGSELTIDYGDWHYDKKKVYKPPKRTVDWLRTHGQCIDNIQIQPAVDQEMGRGAFSKRPIRAGTVVAPAPLQLFRNRADFAQQIPEAMFVNYCLQFAGSDMMLFPYGPGVNLINHSSKKTNVYMRWSTSHMHHSQWLELPAEQMFQMVYPGGLMLEVVALRDIGPNEELFMDYGKDWEDAWNKHVAFWKPLPDAADYVYPGSMDLSQPFRTVEEQSQNPYPKNLLTLCSTGNWEHDPVKTKWKPYQYDWPEGLVHCHIMHRETVKGKEYYTVALDFHGDREFDPTLSKSERFIDKKVPQSAITLADKPYASDLHLKNSFRHPIGLPDNLVPQRWRTTPIESI